MKKIKVIPIISGIIFLILLIFLIIYSERKREFNVYNYPTTIVIKNYSDYKKADTISLVILNKLFLLDTIKLNIYNMRTDLSTDEFEVNAYIEKYRDDNETENKNHLYNIFIRKNLTNIESLLLHELTHLNQMDKGDLVQLNSLIYPHKIVYKKDTIDLLDIKYDYRAYEKDAINFTKENYYKMDNLLYKK